MLALTLVVSLSGCGIFFRIVDSRSEREGLQRAFPATAADVHFMGAMPVLVPLLLIDLPISLAYDLVLLPPTLFNFWYQWRRELRPEAPQRQRPTAPTAPIATSSMRAEEPEPPPAPYVDPPQLELRSGQVDPR